MPDDPVTAIAFSLADEAATYKLLFHQSLHTLRAQQEYLAGVLAARDALRDEIQRYTRAAVRA